MEVITRGLNDLGVISMMASCTGSVITTAANELFVVLLKKTHTHTHIHLQRNEHIYTHTYTDTKKHRHTHNYLQTQ